MQTPSNTIDLRSLRPSRRRDLEVVCRRQANATEGGEWIVKDPIQLNYFFLDQIQHWLFERLDGAASLKETQQAFSQTFLGARISEQQLLNFCLRLNRDGLLNTPLSAEQLQQRRRQQSGTKLHRLPLSLLSIRLPGVNAHWVISGADAIFGWVFTPLPVLIAVTWIMFAALLGIQRIDDIVWALPSIADVKFADVALFLVCVSAVKIIHELAHAVCCRRMGAQCNEIGVMFLVFSPCLYCNVTDSWMLPNQWKRIAISSAGIFVELIIASTALLLWHCAQTELLKSLFLNLMIVCSVSTLLINGNPLMRYDGYFILSDLLNVPNLAQQARKRTWDWFANLFFFTPQSIGRQSKPTHSALLIGYHSASVAYRTFILSVIFWVGYALLKTIGLQSIAIAAGVVYAISLLTSFSLTFTPMIKRKHHQGRKKWAAILTAVILLGSIAYVIFTLKVPHSINASAQIEFNQIAICTAKTNGTLGWTRKRGDTVEQGDVIAQLNNAELALEQTILENKHKLAQLEVDNLKARSSADPETRVALPAAESEVTALTDQLSMLNRRRAELEVIAPASGVLVEATKRPPANDPTRMVAWSGSALDAENIGCEIKKGETICWIGKPKDWKVVLFIDQQKRDLVSASQKVTLRTSLERNKVYHATVGKVFSEAIEQEDSGERQFRVELILDQPLSIGFHGASGKAQVTIDEQTVWEITKRFLTESFRFDI